MDNIAVNKLLAGVFKSPVKYYTYITEMSSI